jgi:hypothetical protein
MSQLIKLEEGDKKAFVAGLKSGLGLTQSATLILIHPKDMSAIIKKDPTFHKECQESLKYAAKVLLVLANQYLADQDFSKWRENNEYIKSFVSDLFLWECYSTKETTTALKAAEAYIMTKDQSEAATACGMTVLEYKQFIIRNPKFKIYMDAVQK